VKCTNGLSAHQFAQLTQWITITQSKPLHTVPTILGVAGSLQATLIYLRHNLPQAAIGESRTMREGAHVGECIERH